MAHQKKLTSAEVFTKPELSLDAIASASRAINILRANSYIDTNSSTTNLSVRRTPYCNAFQPQGVVQSNSAPGALNMTVPNAKKLSFTFKLCFTSANSLLTTVHWRRIPLRYYPPRPNLYLISNLGVSSRCSFGLIATTEVLRIPQLSLGLVASAK